jgi:LemA protein
MRDRGSIHLVLLGTLGFLLLVAGLWAVGTYNGLVARNEEVSKSWATVESQYQRRSDLIPNLVEAVKGSARFEKETLTAVVDARSRVGAVHADKSLLDDPAAFKKFEDAQAHLTSALSRLLVVVERYPDIKSTEAYRTLLAQLESTENAIQAARRDYNDVAQGYNTAIKMFPDLLLARLGHFSERPYFSAAPSAAQAPAVKL